MCACMLEHDDAMPAAKPCFSSSPRWTPDLHEHAIVRQGTRTWINPGMHGLQRTLMPQPIMPTVRQKSWKCGSHRNRCVPCASAVAGLPVGFADP